MLPHDLVRRGRDCVDTPLVRSLEEILDTYAVDGPDGVKLLVLGEVEQDGTTQPIPTATWLKDMAPNAAAKARST